MPGKLGLVLTLIFVVAFFSRLLVVLSFPPQIPEWDYDGRVYDLLAKNVLAGRAYDYGDGATASWRPPLYPFLLAVLYSAVGVNYTAVRIVQAIFGGLTCVLLFPLAARIVNHRVAFLSSVFLALEPNFVFVSALLLTETLAVLLVVLSFLFSVRSIQNGGRIDAVVAGLFLGLSALTRPIAFVFLPALLVGFVLQLRPVSRALCRFLVVCVAALLIISPWTIRNYLVHERFVLLTTQGGYNLYVGNNPWATGRLVRPYLSPQQEEALRHATEVERDQLYFRWSLNHVLENPLRTLKLAGNKQAIFWFDAFGRKSGMVSAVLVLLGSTGALCSVRKWRRYALPYLAITFMAAPFLLFFAAGRFRLLILPFIAVFAAITVDLILMRLHIPWLQRTTTDQFGIY